MRTKISIEVAATPREVFDLARDVGLWPTLLPHYRKVTIHSRNNGRILATMAASRPLAWLAVPVSWRSEQWADDTDADELRLHFSHVAGATKGMQVTWRITPAHGGCRVTIEHDFSRRLPFVGAEAFPRLIDRLFVRPIAGRTLRRFRDLAEAAADHG